MRLLLFLGYCVLVAVGVSSCASHKPMVIQASNARCIPNETFFQYDSLVYTKLADKKVDTSKCAQISQTFTAQSIKIAEDIQALNLLCDLVVLEAQAKNGTLSQPFLLYETRMELNDRITLAMLDISSMLTLLDCEISRTRELQTTLNDATNRRLNHLALISITVASISSLGSNAAAVANGNAWIVEGIAASGALAGVYLGLRSLLLNKQINLQHPHNFIYEIYKPAGQCNIMSPVVWNYLNKPNLINNDHQTIRETLRQTWQTAGYINENGNKKEAANTQLLLGSGGNYTADELDNRIEMLLGIEDKIKLMNYDLKRLTQEIILLHYK